MGDSVIAKMVRGTGTGDPIQVQVCMLKGIFWKYPRASNKSDAAGMLEALQECEFDSVFNTFLVRALINDSWAVYGRPYFLCTFMAQILWLAAFCCCTVAENVTVKVISGSVVLAFSLAFGALEALQIYSSSDVWQYALELWNFLDMLTVAFAAGVGISSFGLWRAPDVWSAIAAVMMWLRVVFFLRGFESTASLVRIILEIIKDSWTFLLLLLNLILAISHGTWMVV